jgi:hypothetical protein
MMLRADEFECDECGVMFSSDDVDPEETAAVCLYTGLPHRSDGSTSAGCDCGARREALLCDACEHDQDGDDEGDRTVLCGWCGSGLVYPLGALGRRVWFRCRSCGMTTGKGADG